MTDNVKDFLAALDRLENDALSNRDGYGYSSGDAETIRRVLAENEQLRKERDDYKQVLDGAKEYAVELLHSAFHDISTPNDALEYVEILIDHLKEKVNKNGNT